MSKLKVIVMFNSYGELVGVLRYDETRTESPHKLIEDWDQNQRVDKSKSYVCSVVDTYNTSLLTTS